MSDRFKFRCWDDYNREMLDLQEQDTNPYNISDFAQHNIMQCTGLKDKNGKLIYEGDILQQPQLPHKVVCEWYKDGFWLNGFMNGAKRELRNMHNWYEVIGNIYENKELLESEG